MVSRDLDAVTSRVYGRPVIWRPRIAPGTAQILIRMNPMKRNIKYISLIKDTQFGTNMISLKNSFELLALFRTFGFRILNAIGTLGRGYPTRLNFMLKFFHYILHLQKNHGEEFVVQYLKTGQLAIQKKLAGTPVSSCRELNPDLNLPRLANGFPFIIPVSDRRLMMRGASTVIRY